MSQRDTVDEVMHIAVPMTNPDPQGALLAHSIEVSRELFEEIMRADRSTRRTFYNFIGAQASRHHGYDSSRGRAGFLLKDGRCFITRAYAEAIKLQLQD